jgi:hypothetical protein
LSLAMFVSPPVLVLGILLLAYFTDERALIASSLVYVYFLVEKIQSYQVTIYSLFKFNSKIVALFLSWIIYFVCRILLSLSVGLYTNTKGLMDYLLSETIHHINSFSFGLWTGLEGFWILLALSFLILIHNKEKLLALLYALAMLPVTVTAIWVFDITRSMAYLLPAIFISLILLYRSESKLGMRYISLVVLGLCLFPTYYVGGSNQISWFYPLPVQLFRMFMM